MHRAAAAAAQLAQEILSEHRNNAKVLVLAGPGNNGGDALLTAAHLAQIGVDVTVLLYADPHQQPRDSQCALEFARNSAACFAEPPYLSLISNTSWSLVVDGLLGIGLARGITGEMRSIIEDVNRLDCKVLALDVPSGLDADTGNIIGGSGIAVRATHTITFIADKPGLHTCDGRDYAGEVHVSSLQLTDNYFMPPNAQLNEVSLFANALRQRPHNSHKGSYGDVSIVGGARGMSGASMLAARAAAQCGAGRVYAMFIDDVPAYDNVAPELMCRPAQDCNFSSSTLVLGPGMGTSSSACELLTKALTTPAPIVLDADALNLIAVTPVLQNLITQRTASTVITPHPLEAARLLATSSTVVQADRVSAARELASRFNAVAILKGSGTVIARPDGVVVINTTGNPALATAGTGDVLAGACGALLAQQWPVWNTALGAVWMHGHAADMLVRQGVGPIGLTAHELIAAIRADLNRLVKEFGKSNASRN